MAERPQPQCYLSRCNLYMPIKVVHASSEPSNCCHFHKKKIIQRIALQLFANKEEISCPKCKKAITEIKLCKMHSDQTKAHLEENLPLTPSHMDPFIRNLMELFENSRKNLTMVQAKDLYQAKKKELDQAKKKELVFRRRSRRGRGSSRSRGTSSPSMMTDQSSFMQASSSSSSMDSSSQPLPAQKPVPNPIIDVSDDDVYDDEGVCLWETACNSIRRSGIGQILFAAGALLVVGFFSIGDIIMNPNGRTPTTRVTLNDNS